MQAQKIRRGTAVAATVLAVTGVVFSAALITRHQGGRGVTPPLAGPGASTPGVAVSSPASTPPTALVSPIPTVIPPVTKTVWTPTAAEVASVSAIATWVATADRDPAAVATAAAVPAARYIGTTRAGFHAFMGDGTLTSSDESNTRVIVVYVTGKFVGFNAKVPRGAALPKGNAIIFAWDPATKKITDWGIPSASEGVNAASLGRTIGQSQALNLNQ